MSETIKISTQEFKKVMQTASLTSSKEKDNILSNALIEIKNSKITVVSKNSITKSKQIIEIENESIDKTILINPHTVFNIFKELKENETEMIIEDNLIKIKNGKFKTNIKTLNQELYPNEQQEEEMDKKTTLPFEKIKHLFKSTTPYPDKNDISREYTGVFIEIQNENLKASATDHFRLINIVTNIENSNTNISFIIENEGASLISKVEMEKDVEFLIGKNNIALKDNNKIIYSKTIEGKFPEYQAILLDENSNFITINRNGILSSIKRVSITNQKNEIELEIKPNQKTLIVSSQNQEGEESTDETQIINSNNENEIKIKLDSRFAMNFLSQITTENIELFYRSSEEPIMLKASENEYLYNYIMTPIIE